MKECACRDRNGRSLRIGDHVLIETISDSLLTGLLEEDKKAIRSQIGRELVVAGFDNYENAELEFNHSDSIHTIWIKASALRKLDAAKGSG